ncbi:hypothetical protein FRB99_006271, partial [Tulasnella sp. 403]
MSPAGNLAHYREGLQEATSIDSQQRLDHLERELMEVVTPLKNRRVKLSLLVFPKADSTVGIGGFGTVHWATMKSQRKVPDLTVAVKKLRTAGGRDKCLRMVIALVRELAVWANLSHPHIVPLIGFYLGDHLDQAWLISPYMSTGNLSDYLRRAKPDMRNRVRLAMDTALGLEYLHNLDPPVCHGDIKSLNVLITDEGRGAICDFGLAKSMESMPSGLTTSTFNQGGSLPYESPELLSGDSLRTPESDVWAWGCLLQEIFTGKIPYHWAVNPGAIVKWIVEDIPPAVLDSIVCPDRVRRLLVHCWQRDPSMRPTMEQCVQVLSGNESRLPTTAAIERGMRLRLTLPEITFEQYSPIGSGAHGTVFRGTLLREGTTTPSVVAVKQLFPVESAKQRARLVAALNEGVQTWAGIEHANVAQIKGFYADATTLMGMLLVFPFISGLTLGDYLERYWLDDTERWNMGNVMMSEDGHPVLCDYGLGTVVDRAGVSFDYPEGVAPSEDSIRYRGPELKVRPGRTLRSDIWSWGCLFLKIVAKRTPYQDVDVASMTEPPAVIEELECSQRAKNLLALSWRASNMRPPISDIVEVLDGAAFRFEETVSIPEERGVSLKLSLDGEQLAIGWEDNIDFYGTRVGDALPSLQLLPGTGTPSVMQPSVSGKFFVVATTDNHIHVWGSDSVVQRDTFIGHKDHIHGLDISCDDLFVASGSQDATVRLWYLNGEEKNNQILHVTHPVFCIDISPRSDIVAAGLQNGGIRVFDTRLGTLLASFGNGSVWTVSISSENEALIGGDNFNEVRMWDLSNLHHTKEVSKSLVVDKHSATVSFVSVSADGSFV